YDRLLVGGDPFGYWALGMTAFTAHPLPYKRTKNRKTSKENLKVRVASAGSHQERRSDAPEARNATTPPRPVLVKGGGGGGFRPVVANMHRANGQQLLSIYTAVFLVHRSAPFARPSPDSRQQQAGAKARPGSLEGG